jgi:hypothetical protein
MGARGYVANTAASLIGLRLLTRSCRRRCSTVSLLLGVLIWSARVHRAVPAGGVPFYSG